MEIVRAIVLGIVQGLSEFLPVSSSGHLILVRDLFRWPDDGLAFDVGLHLGTLTALLVYFWREWLRMLTAMLSAWRRYGPHIRQHEPMAQLPWLLALGTVPAGIVGLLFGDWIEEHGREAWIVGVVLILFAGVMLVAERLGDRNRTLLGVGPVDAILIGVAQAVALIPGVSRSGVTISAALFRGLTREDAARFAFLLGTPTFIGAGILKANDLRGESGSDAVQLLIGFFASMVVGFAAIHGLLNFLRRRSLNSFAVYRVLIGGITLVAVGLAAVA